MPEKIKPPRRISEHLRAIYEEFYDIIFDDEAEIGVFMKRRDVQLALYKFAESQAKKKLNRFKDMKMSRQIEIEDLTHDAFKLALGDYPVIIDFAIERMLREDEENLNGKRNSFGLPASKFVDALAVAILGEIWKVAKEEATRLYRGETIDEFTEELIVMQGLDGAIDSFVTETERLNYVVEKQEAQAKEFAEHSRKYNALYARASDFLQSQRLALNKRRELAIARGKITYGEEMIDALIELAAIERDKGSRYNAYPSLAEKYKISETQIQQYRDNFRRANPDQNPWLRWVIRNPLEWDSEFSWSDKRRRIDLDVPDLLLVDQRKNLENEHDF